MNQLLNESFRVPAIVTPDHEVSYGEMRKRIQLFAQNAPLQRGCKSILLCENREGWIYAFFSIWLQHGIVVPVDAASTVQDLAYVIHDCQAEHIWASASRQPIVEQTIGQSGATLAVTYIDPLERADIPDSSPEAAIDYEPSDTAVITYTSGTTGQAKGVMLSFSNLLANGEAVIETLHVDTSTMRSILLLPLHHALPMQASLLMPMLAGAGVSLCPSLLGSDIMETLQRSPIGIMVGVPVLWSALIKIMRSKVYARPFGRPMFQLCRLLHWRWLSRRVFAQVHQLMGQNIHLVSGGAALDPEVVRDCLALGLTILEGYGMSETSPVITFTRKGEIQPGSVGRPLRGVDVMIKEGEICVRGHNIMQGYYGRPAETAALFDDEGWLHTGDEGHFDRQGRLYVTGRKKEIIVFSNGKNVNPIEIEERLLAHQDIVKEVAVTEKDDVLHAIVIPTTAWLRAHQDEDQEVALRRELIKPYNKEAASYKRILAVTLYGGELPRNRMGKLQRFKLKDLLSANVWANRK